MIVLRRAIRTCPTAILASKTLVCIDEYNAIVALGDCPRRTHFGANGFFAMIARHREVVGKHVIDPGMLALGPSAARHFIDAPPQDAHGQVVLIFACRLTCFTARASGRIEKELVLVHPRLLRQPNRKNTSVAMSLACRGDGPTMRFDERFCNRQSQPRFRFAVAR